MSDDSNTTSVTSTNNHDSITRIKFNRVCNFSSFNIDYNGVIDFDIWVRVTNCSGVMSDNVWNWVLANTDSLDFSKFVLYKTKILNGVLYIFWLNYGYYSICKILSE